MTRKWGIAVLAVTVYAGGALTNLVFTAHTVAVSQHRWCATLGLLTSIPAQKATPPGPHATPEQKTAWRSWVFYQDLQRLHHDYGCGGG